MPNDELIDKNLSLKNSENDINSKFSELNNCLTILKWNMNAEL